MAAAAGFLFLVLLTIQVNRVTRSHPNKEFKYRSFLLLKQWTSATTESSSQTSTEYSEDAQEQAAVSDEVNEDDFPNCPH